MRRLLHALVVVACAAAAASVAGCDDNADPRARRAQPSRRLLRPPSTTAAAPAATSSPSATRSSVTPDVDEVELPGSATFGDLTDLATAALRGAGTFQKVLTTTGSDGESLPPTELAHPWEFVDVTSNSPQVWVEPVGAEEVGPCFGDRFA